jgi:hypothetical protein
MVRALNVFLLGCLILVGGAVGLFLAAWVLAAAGLGGIVGHFVAIGVAILIPCSFLWAGSLLPGPPRPPANLLICPHCGGAFPVWFQQARPHRDSADAPTSSLPPELDHVAQSLRRPRLDG